jgi:hypothetical protein
MSSKAKRALSSQQSNCIESFTTVKFEGLNMHIFMNTVSLLMVFGH